MTDPILQAKKLLSAEGKRVSKALETDRTRKRGDLNRRLHEIRQMMNVAYAFSSQAGQDLVVDEVSGRKRGGTFLDVGGYDGVTGSNTYFLEKNRGWTGALVEPVPAQLAKAKSLRTCPCIGLAIAPTEGEADFIEISKGYTQMSGLAKTYDKKLLKTVRADGRHKEKKIKVKTQTLSGLMQETGLMHPDFVSLDIEGGELACLKDFPFERHSVGIWAIENNTGGKEIREIMMANGYALIEFCGPDEMYRKRDN